MASCIIFRSRRCERRGKRRRSGRATRSSSRRQPRSGCTGGRCRVDHRLAGCSSSPIRRRPAVPKPRIADRGSRIGDRGRRSVAVAYATLLRGVRLGRLPHAREESRAIAHHVAGADVLIGATASERAVKARDLRTYDVLHFAAHAVADEAHPERSAVLLAPGGSAEDGLLQAREIAALDIEGSIVVLSACQTAAGAVLSGEGVLSLARAFFEGGAHAVIGTRWPLRDADAAVLFDTFYRHLARGRVAVGGTQGDPRRGTCGGTTAIGVGGTGLARQRRPPSLRRPTATGGRGGPAPRSACRRAHDCRRPRYRPRAPARLERLRSFSSCPQTVRPRASLGCWPTARARRRPRGR